MSDAQKLVDGLSGFTPGPWNTDTGGEVHKDGTTIFGWPKWVDQSGAAEIHSNMALGAAATDLHAAVVALLADNAKLRAALDGIAQDRDYPMGIGIDPRPSRCAEIAIAALEATK